MEGSAFVLFTFFGILTKLVGTDQVDTECVPRDVFRILLGRKFAALALLGLCLGADWTAPTRLLDAGLQTRPCLMLVEGEL